MKEKLDGPKPARPASASGEEEKASFTLRLHPEVLEEIEALLGSIPQRRRPSRNDWITQAIEEKTKRGHKGLVINILCSTKQQLPKARCHKNTIA